MSGCFTCVYCLRDTFATSRALSQHLSKNDDCRAQMEARINALDDAQSGTNKVLEFATITRHKYDRHDFYEEVSRVRKAPKVLDTSGVPLSRTSYNEYVQQQRTAFEDSDEDFAGIGIPKTNAIALEVSYTHMYLTMIVVMTTICSIILHLILRMLWRRFAIILKSL